MGSDYEAIWVVFFVFAKGFEGVDFFGLWGGVQDDDVAHFYRLFCAGDQEDSFGFGVVDEFF